MNYISLFSGVGGLEAEESPPLLCCEIDQACQRVLKGRFPETQIHERVEDLHPPRAEIVAGGWPCQDLSVAGKGRGLAGDRSGLFFELVRVARESKAHTIIAENVPNLIRLRQGAEFQAVLEHFSEEGFPHIGWRILNARQFGLPHQRLRVFIVASRVREHAMSLHRTIDPAAARLSTNGRCNAFYWTAGLQSICYSEGFVPTLKVGSSLSIPSPPAVFFEDTVRKASPDECLRLQGFDPSHFRSVRPKDVYRMSGNAVAAPVGRFVFESVSESTRAIEDSSLQPAFAFASFPPDGLWSDGTVFAVDHDETNELASNLIDFIDTSNREPLSQRAASGLLNRLDRSGKPCPANLREILTEIADPKNQEASPELLNGL